MRKRTSQIIELLALASIVVLDITQTCWAGPPGPPGTTGSGSGIITAPLGGDGILIVTTVAIAGYGYWKSRK
ncbi:MAG: hypothetical protein P4L44_06770 [Oryzomonas sp.]|uniref:hypothetical protein n=1 Tax=Oryzomonas sp. TaxID=2855186 RepID=UPI00283DCA85|nr:hypothetical protein [Oryzomonas sp.]MDR3579646.1 hypothetical protein [Oryzomonas sp.]